MRRTSFASLSILGIMLLCGSMAGAQALYQISTDQKISRSTLIVEGKVTAKRSYWNASHTMIFTDNDVEVYKVFKGRTNKSIIQVKTVGGAVENYSILASDLLELHPDDVGVFFCTPAAGGRFQVYSSAQGFLKYDLQTKTATEPFGQYNDIEKTLYQELSNKAGQRIEIKNNTFSIEKAARELSIGSNSTLAPLITSFTPAIVHAGALKDPENNLLSIRGSGFGAGSSQAAVQFNHADYSPGTQFVTVPYNSPLVVSWTDTEIKVRVPFQAGTGTYRIRDAGGNLVSSPSPLNVLYSILNADFGGAYGIKQYTLGNRNGNGGYDIKYSTSTANSGLNINNSQAKATFQRALATWRAIGINFAEAGTTTIQAVNTDDDENVVMFDNAGTGLDDPLADGVLATCFSGSTICTNDPVNNQAIKTGFDIVIRNTGYSTGNTKFTFGPCSPYSGPEPVVDLETVLLHELGHGVNLGHIVDRLEGAGAGTTNPSKVMNFSINLSHRRISLDYSSKAGALYLLADNGFVFGNCVTAPAQMQPLEAVLEPKDDCPANFPTTTTPLNSSVNFDLVHATSNKFVDPLFSQMTLDGTGVNLTNNAYYAVRTNGTGGNLQMRITGYTTTPADIAACPVGFGGFQVSGVRLSVYEASSCPTANAYPTPIAYTTFNGNETLPVLNGLDASSNYLVVVDGIQNTKANFNIVFSGTALLERVTNLEGTIFNDYNQLTWTTDTVFNIASMRLERSGDGTNFEQLRDIVGSEQESGEYRDNDPLEGDNYYRLAVENTNGTIQYTEVVLLSRSETFTMSVTNNPVHGNADLKVQINNNSAGTYWFALRNMLGQQVFSKQVSVPGGARTVALPVGTLQSGVYYLTTYSKEGEKLMTVKVAVMN